jgi:RNA polymerase sigma factor (sigma-70 family)
LVYYAARLAWGLRWEKGIDWEIVAGIGVEDLVQELIEKTLTGKNKWDPDRGPLMPWLKARIRGIIWNLYESAAFRHEAELPESADDEYDECVQDRMEYRAITREGFGVAGFLAPEQALLTKETTQERKEFLEQRVDAIFQAVSGEEDLEEVLEAVMGGCDPRPRFVAEHLGVEARDIYNRRKRIRRRVSEFTG